MSLRKSVIRLAYEKPNLRSFLLPLVTRKKVAREIPKILEGKNIRVYADRFMIRVVEIPQKPLRRRSVRTLSIPINAPGSRPFDAFIVDNLLHHRDGAKIGKNDTYDQALKKLQKALSKAEELTTKEWEEQKIDGKPDPWFPRISQDEINYLLVEPSDYKPLSIKGKDFTLQSTWTDFKAYDPGADFQSHDPTYTVIVSKSPTGARKLYKMLKVNPDALKRVSWYQLTDWLRKNKINFDSHGSVYR